MSDKITKSPHIRFAGFTDAWEQRKFKGFISKSGKKNTMDENYSAYSVSNKLGLVSQTEQFDGSRLDDLDKTSYKLVNPNEFAYNPARINVGSIAFNNLNKTVIVSSLYVVLKMSEELDNEFILQFIKSQLFTNEVRRNTEGSVREYLFFENFSNIKFPFTSKDEQIKIGNFFKQLDDTITLHQRKLELLKETKKSLLQKMFPKDGANVPEIRFAGFTDAWEQCKLGQIGKTQSGIGFPDAEQGGTQGIPFFKVSDMNNAGNEHEMIIANNYVSDEQLQRKKWKLIETVPAVIFAKVGAAIMLNRKRLVRTQFLIDNNTMAYIFDDCWDTNFGKTLFETINLPKYAQVGALPSYNGSDIENIEVKVPQKDEQAKVGEFFNNLDNLITLHQRELNSLENLKKSLFQQMFI